MEWLNGVDPETIEAVQFGTPEWLYVEPGTLKIGTVREGDNDIPEWIEFEDKYSEHQVRGPVVFISVVRYRKADS